MKRKPLIIVPFLILMMAAGCVHSFERSAFTLLDANKLGFESARDTAVAMYRIGRMNEQEKEKAITIGEVYAKSHNTAVRALDQYVQTKESDYATIVEVQIATLAAALSELTSMLKPYLIEEEQ